MSDSMIERVAKALCEADTLAGYPPWEMLTPGEFERYRLRACGAIGAMRNPTDAVIEALRFVSAPRPNHPEVPQVWESGKRRIDAFCSAFVDAALKQEGG
jgi:hypothetical protein